MATNRFTSKERGIRMATEEDLQTFRAAQKETATTIGNVLKTVDLAQKASQIGNQSARAATLFKALANFGTAVWVAQYMVEGIAELFEASEAGERNAWADGVAAGLTFGALGIDPKLAASHHIGNFEKEFESGLEQAIEILNLPREPTTIEDYFVSVWEMLATDDQLKIAQKVPGGVESRWNAIIDATLRYLD